MKMVPAITEEVGIFVDAVKQIRFPKINLAEEKEIILETRKQFSNLIVKNAGSIAGGFLGYSLFLSRGEYFPINDIELALTAVSTPIGATLMQEKYRSMPKEAWIATTRIAVWSIAVAKGLVNAEFMEVGAGASIVGGSFATKNEWKPNTIVAKEGEYFSLKEVLNFQKNPKHGMLLALAVASGFQAVDGVLDLVDGIVSLSSMSKTIMTVGVPTCLYAAFKKPGAELKFEGDCNRFADKLINNWKSFLNRPQKAAFLINNLRPILLTMSSYMNFGANIISNTLAANDKEKQR